MPTQPKKKRALTTWTKALKEWNRRRDPTVYCIPKKKFNGKVTNNWKKVKEIQKEIEKKAGKFQKKKSSKKSK